MRAPITRVRMPRRRLCKAAVVPSGPVQSGLVSSPSLVPYNELARTGRVGLRRTDPNTGVCHLVTIGWEPRRPRTLLHLHVSRIMIPQLFVFSISVVQLLTLCARPCSPGASWRGPLLKQSVNGHTIRIAFMARKGVKAGTKNNSHVRPAVGYENLHLVYEAEDSGYMVDVGIASRPSAQPTFLRVLTSRTLL